MIVDYIDSYQGRFGVEPVCAVLAEAGIAIAPSTYYARSKAPLTEAEVDDAYLANALRSLWQDNWGVYGASASCGMRPAASATTWAATRWPG
jgi:putative transposase